MELAQRHFNIPLVLEPEYLASPHLDELSGMTYLSYFMKVMLMQIGNLATLQIGVMLRRFVNIQGSYGGTIPIQTIYSSPETYL